MKIPTLSIKRVIEKEIRRNVSKLKKRKISPHLVTILIGESSEQESFVAIKKKVASSLGIRFTLIHLKKTPIFEKFANLIKENTQNPDVNGIIIQQPLPPQLQTDTIYNYIPLVKEVEGHRYKSEFNPPVGMAVLTGIKYVFDKQKVDSSIIVTDKDKDFFKKKLKNRKVVLVGRGLTGGLPVGKTLSNFKINYFNVGSKTENQDQYYADADIIITAVGKKILLPEKLKDGVVLINVGLRKETNKLKGDYDENEIKQKASFYTVTPGGIGPIDVLYLFKNLVTATYLQH